MTSNRSARIRDTGGSDPEQGRLDLRHDGPIATLTIDNPRRHNALNRRMWADLPGLLALAAANPDNRVIVLRGAGGKAFSAGADISEFGEVRTGTAARDYDDLNNRAFEALADVARPTIAMIEGFCLGGGLELAICCDLRIAGQDASFSIPPARLGIGYDPRWIKPLLRTVSAARIKELIFTGRRFSAAEAGAMGLVNRVVPAGELDAQVAALANEIAANAPLSILAAKRAIDQLSDHPERDDYRELDRLVANCFASQDYAEGRAAFAEKRKPRFKGD